MQAKRINRRTVRIALAAVGLLSLVAITVVAAMGAENQNSDTIDGPDRDAGAVTDSTAPSGEESSRRDPPVTDTTLAPPPEPRDTRSADSTTTTTTAASTTTSTLSDRMKWDYFLRRESHPAWDDRLPGGKEGIEATECNDTFEYRVLDNPNWISWWARTWHYLTAHDEVIALALENPGWEPHTGPGRYPARTDDIFEPHTEAELNQALADLGVSSAQQIRDMGGEIEVRWYAWWLKRMINWNGVPHHPSCASIIEGANAVLAPYQATTTP